ncbi:MAG: NAD(P)-dependent glycerol-3-phosphate dehydrogenase [Fimbriimonadaceae bacterium]|nr:MAG: NAD(P)-dependent glycerol-3-phosphate dehydrogenase [Fimbriimonadaceae bacterium]
MRIRVIGAGSWGTALSLVLARNVHSVELVAHDEPTALQLSKDRENKQYMAGFAFPESITVSSFGKQSGEVDFTVMAVPTAAVREVMAQLPEDGIFCLASKGLDPTSGGVLSDVLAELRPKAIPVALSGPNLAVELAKGVPTAAVCASPSESAAELVRLAFNSKSYRVYIGEDIRGVEIAGALKNVIAIGAGICDGLGFGDNTKGAFLCRGLAEITKLGVAMGAKLETFLGLAGVGDLFATANSKLSRNFRVGLAIADGKTLDQAVESLGQVAEGVPTLHVALRMAKELNVEVPLMTVLDAVLKGEIGFEDAISRLMERQTRFELGEQK